MGFKVSTTQHQKHDEQIQPYPPALETPLSFMSTKALWLPVQLDVRLVSLMSAWGLLLHTVRAVERSATGHIGSKQKQMQFKKSYLGIHLNAQHEES